MSFGTPTTFCPNFEPPYTTKMTLAVVERFEQVVDKKRRSGPTHSSCARHAGQRRRRVGMLDPAAVDSCGRAPTVVGFQFLELVVAKVSRGPPKHGTCKKIGE
jgi:hypothetical protein